MVLNDVWRTIGNEVGFYYEVNFEQVPSAPGVYAWFYPLRILSRSVDALEKLAGQAQAVLNYDAGCDGPPERDAQLPVSWWRWGIRASRQPKPLELGALIPVWEQIVNSDALFEELQISLLKSSVFMPPLYVGKANNLNARCSQHIDGVTGANDFHRRYEDYARKLELPLRSVRKLIFVCVKTGAIPDPSDGAEPSPVHELVEGVMKSICAPPYGVR